MVAPEQGPQVIAALSSAGLRFSEGGPDGAGCAGPTLVVLRLEGEASGLQERVDLALAGLHTEP